MSSNILMLNLNAEEHYRSPSEGHPKHGIHGGEETEPGEHPGRPGAAPRVETAPERDVALPEKEGETRRREGRPGEGKPRGARPGEREGGPRRAGEPDVKRVPGSPDALIDDLLGAADQEITQEI